MEMNLVASSVYMCNTCEISFSSKFNLKRHLERIHKIKLTANANSRITCTYCATVFSTTKALVVHLDEHHSIKVDITNHEFDNKQDFLTWKKSVEKATCSFYVKGRSTAAKDVTTTYYLCHRSGFYQRKGNKRAQKVCGSNKINGTCPATMRVVESKDDERRKVSFISTHVGHNNETYRLRLTEEERNDLVLRLSQGDSKKNILADIKGNFDTKERISYTTRKDLANIFKTIRKKSSEEEIKINIEEKRSEVNLKINELHLFVINCENIGQLNKLETLLYQVMGEIEKS